MSFTPALFLSVHFCKPRIPAQKNLAINMHQVQFNDNQFYIKHQIPPGTYFAGFWMVNSFNEF